MFKKPSFKLSTDFWILIIGSAISLAACIIFYNLNLQLSNFDALSRMNIARKITDNLTPGLGQFGSVWPFLPQLIMMPFAAITPLWHSGIAGTIMSAPAFIISGYLIYLIILEITQSKFAAIIGFLIFITNVNLLLLQTMGMSESLFIVLILGAMYGLLRWMRNPTYALFALVLAGACLSGASLVRYEGLPFSFAAIAVVFIIVFIKKHNLKTIEGVTIFFATITLFGLFIWCLYNALIFKDPLYWEKIYTGQARILSTDSRQRATKMKPFKINIKTIESKSVAYINSVAEMSGIPLFLIGMVSFTAYIFYFRPFRDQKPFIILLPLSISAFMFATFYKSSLPLVVPPLNLSTITNFNTTYKIELNIRYGILLWPFIVVMIGWLISRNNFFKKMGIIVLIIAILTPLYHKAFLIYQLPLIWDRGSAVNEREYPGRDWLKANYKGGLIFISAYKHDPIMFQLGYPYKTFIHEGTEKYWLTSVKQPEVYAEWIFMADPKNIAGGAAAGEVDPVTAYLLQNDPTFTRLNTYYEERFSDGHIDIYQRRAHPLDKATQSAQTANLYTSRINGKLIDSQGNPIQKQTFFRKLLSYL